MFFGKFIYRNAGSILCILIICGCINCGIRRGNDIYKKIPIGSQLSLKTLRDADQIIINKSDLILLYDISDDWNHFSPHLLFYDSTLKLYAASFFSSDKIDSLNDNIISGILFESRATRKKLYRNDLPKAYQLNLYNSKTVTTSFNRANTIIESMELSANGKDITLSIRRSKDMFIGVGYQRSPKNDLVFFQNFTIPDTIVYSMSEIIFDFNRSVLKRKFIESNQMIREEMIFVNLSTLENFYSKIFSFPLN